MIDMFISEILIGIDIGITALFILMFFMDKKR